ncbi:ATP-binding protein [Candidatus Dependentiae bacterium]|nr:ATP-binding protein [Candidatus Dependentiae bacterium]
MKRIIDYFLAEWKKDELRKPLLLRGARQVGKTYAVRALAKKFDSFVEINLEQDEVARKIIERDMDVHRILLQLSTHRSVKIIPGKTLLFFDEIQQVPQAISCLRYFYEQIPDLHVIAAGSLLEFAIQQVGIPVGRVSSLYLYPVSFLEFLAAQKKYLWIKTLLSQTTNEPLFEELHTTLMNELALFIVVGGMPEAINAWFKTTSLQTVSTIHHSLLDAYQQDFGKYAKKHQIKYLEILFQHAIGQIGNKFMFSRVGEYKKRELAPALDLLEKAGLIHKIFKTAAQGLPLGAQADLDDFKIAFLDTGLCLATLGLDIASWIIDPSIAFINNGAVVESFVGQELLAYAPPSRKKPLFYWRKDQKGSDAEVDYVIQLNQSLVPVEVKSGTSKRIKSSYLFLESHPEAQYAIRFSARNYEHAKEIFSFPLYAIANPLAHADAQLSDAIKALMIE